MADDYKKLSLFDRYFGALEGLPTVIKTQPAPRTVVVPVTGEVTSWIVQTWRQRDVGDHISLVYVSEGVTFRIPIPPDVADLIARQRDALTARNRKAGAKAGAATRKAMGIVPGFLKKKKGD